MKPKIAIPEPCSQKYDPAYCEKSLPPYLHAVERCGGEPVVIPVGLAPEEIARRITRCSAILLPGSKADLDPQKYGAERAPQTAPADELRDAADELLLQDAYNLRKPIFGICYGLQSLNVWRTGTLVQHIESGVNHVAKGAAMAHPVRIEPDSLLDHLLARNSKQNSVPVNSSHHQAAGIVGDGLRVTARCADDGIIEAMEGTLPDHYVLAVQWHPERDFDANQSSRLLFQSFVDAAAKWHAVAEQIA